MEKGREELWECTLIGIWKRNYNSQGNGRKVKKEGVKTLIGGDFNTGIDNRGGGMEEKRGEKGMVEREKRSKDRKVNGEGRVLVNFMEERGWSILNGVVKEDKEGEYTYTEYRGNSVIDYVVGEGEMREKIRKWERK